jgi:hypothetical protein
MMSAKAFHYGDMPNIGYGTSSPVFIVGAPRSGTTLLVQLLRKYFNINFGTESQFIVHYYKRIAKFGDLSDSRNMHHLIRKVVQERCFARWKKQFGFSLNIDRLKREIREPTFRGLLDGIYGQFAKFAGRTRWGDKYPPYSLDMPVLEVLYPEAQYIHIFRDGRDVGLSLQHVGFGPRNFMQAAFFWKQYVTSAQNFGRTITKTRFHEIRYEALLQDPVKVMTDLAGFVQIEEGYQEVITRIKRQIHGDLLADNGLKWQKGLTESQVQMFEKGAGELLENLGYEVHSWDRKEPTLIEKSASYIDNVYRRYTNKNILHHELSKFRARIHRP